MQWSPFLEIFITLFLAAGAALGWFTRIPVIVIALTVWVLVAGGIMIAEQAMDYQPWNWDLDREAHAIYALLGAFAAVPAFATALLGRMLKRRLRP